MEQVQSPEHARRRLLVRQGEHGSVHGGYRDPQVGMYDDQRRKLDSPVGTVKVGDGFGRVSEQ